MIQRPKNKRVLFLIRAYNDLDHIAPVIWKMASMGYGVDYLLTAGDFPDDYRIRVIEDAGAKRLNCRIISGYYERVRGRLKFSLLRRINDWGVALVFGCLFLRRHSTTCIVVEWAGADGRAQAPFFLRSARIMGLPTIAIPHGYHTWLDNHFNETTQRAINETGKLPQLADRNQFSLYVVQSENIKRYCSDSGILEENLEVLGSARFCSEWSKINQRLCSSLGAKFSSHNDQRILVVFFLNHWQYNVDRGRCLRLLKAIGAEDQVRLVIKGHTRGRDAGGLSLSEEKMLDQLGNVLYPDEKIHSPDLVEQADLVVVYGSSICFEALRQGKVIVWPRFVCANPTIFDEGGVVTVAESEKEVIETIRAVAKGKKLFPSQALLDAFFYTHVEGDSAQATVLERYAKRIGTYLE